MKEEEDLDIIKVDIVLSRPSYRLGSTVVGTIRVVVCNNNIVQNNEPTTTAAATTTTERNDNSNISSTIRDRIESLELILVGRCKLDLRWHNLKRYENELFQHNLHQPPLLRSFMKHHQESSSSTSAAAAAESSSSSSSYCFWSTNAINLLQLPERTNGRWDDVKPKPIYIPGMKMQDESSEESSSYSSSSSSEDEEDDEEEEETTSAAAAAAAAAAGATTSSSLPQQLDQQQQQQQQLLFTFRVDLPYDDIPHSMVGSSCRYYYNVGVRLKRKRPRDTTSTASKSQSQQPQNLLRWYQVPFTVLTADPDSVSTVAVAGGGQQQQDSATTAQQLFRTKITPCIAMAHSTGLPYAVTAVELARPGGQLSVNRHGPCLYRHIGYRGGHRGGGSQHKQQHVQTMRVANPSGDPVCVLTLLGATAPIYPGSRIILKLDFPTSSVDWVPCYQVSACLEGEEWALRPTSTDTNTKKTKARTYLFDTAHERIDPDTAERVCLHLMLPFDAPCSLESSSPFVSITIRCIVDISVLKSNTKAGSTNCYQNLRLEVPIKVVHSLATYERKEDDDYDDTRQIPTLDELLPGCGYDNNDNGNSNEEHRTAASGALLFPTKDITDELKILSLHMADKCGLITTTTTTR